MSGLKVGDVMTRDVVVVRHGTPLKEIARQLSGHRISALPVLDEEDRLVGLVSEADLMRRETFGLADARRRWRLHRRRVAGDSAEDLMSVPVITISPETDVSRAARLMDTRGLKRLVVIDAEHRLVGIVSRADLVRIFLREDDEIRREVISDVLVRLLRADPELVDVRVQDGVVTLNGRLTQRSQIPVAVRLTRSVDGVVDVVNRLGYTVDDVTRRVRPVELWRSAPA
jgi:CBS domain-containing protein